MISKQGAESVARASVLAAALTLCPVAGCSLPKREAPAPSIPAQTQQDRVAETGLSLVRQVAFDAEEHVIDAAATADPEAELPAPVVSEVSDWVGLALATHPKVAAARNKVAAMKQRVPQTSALADPVLGNTFWPIHDQALQTAGGRVGHQFTIAQDVPWPAKRSARAAVACREVLIAQAELAAVEREIAESVRLALYDLWLREELLRILEANQEVVSDLITVAEARFAAGGPQSDLLRAEAEGDRIEDQLIAVTRERELAQADLGTLTRQPVDLIPAAPTELNLTDAVPQLESLVAQAEQCNPSLKGLSAEIARDLAKQNVACLERYPDFQVGIGYSIISDNSNVLSPVANGRDNINFALGVTLPVWRDKIRAGVREAQFSRASSSDRREAERDRLAGQIRRQVATVHAASQRLALFRDRVVPRAQRTLDIAMADYRGKKTEFADLVDSYRELLAYQTQVAITRAELAAAMARIRRLVGCEI